MTATLRSNLEAFNGMSEIKLDYVIIVSSALSLSLNKVIKIWIQECGWHYIFNLKCPTLLGFKKLWCIDHKLTMMQGIVKTGRLDFSLFWLKGKVRENLGDFRKSIQISFPTTACSPTFHKTNMLHNDLKRMQLTSLE